MSECHGEELPKGRLVLVALLLPTALPWKGRCNLWSRIKDNFVLGRGEGREYRFALRSVSFIKHVDWCS